MRKRMIWMAPLALLAMVIFIWVGGEVVRMLWNWLMPTMFGWRQITFWQAVGLLALCRILFGGFGRGGGGFRRSRIQERVGERVRERMAERWEKMTPEEREKCRQEFFGRWGRTSPPDPKPNE